MQGDVSGRFRQCLADSFSGSADHFRINTELPAVGNSQSFMLRRIPIENRRNVILGMACGKQHARNGEDMVVMAFPKAVETIADNRRRKLKKT